MNSKKTNISFLFAAIVDFLHKVVYCKIILQIFDYVVMSSFKKHRFKHYAYTHNTYTTKLSISLAENNIIMRLAVLLQADGEMTRCQKPPPVSTCQKPPPVSTCQKPP